MLMLDECDNKYSADDIKLQSQLLALQLKLSSRFREGESDSARDRHTV